MTRRSPKPLNKRLRSIYSWHRWLGVISAVFVIWLSISGIILEHSHQLELDKRPVSAPWLLKSFGIEINTPESALHYEDHWVSHVDGRIYLNQQMIDHGTTPVGISRLGLIWAIASREKLWVLNDQGEVLDKVEGLDLPARIIAINNTESGLLIQTERGNYVADPLSARWPRWLPTDLGVNPGYSSSTLPDELKSQLTQQAKSYALTWERVLVEAHSGRLFGEYGVWVMDAMAIIFIVLGITGLSLWIRYRRAARKRRVKLKPH